MNQAESESGPCWLLGGQPAVNSSRNPRIAQKSPGGLLHVFVEKVYQSPRLGEHGR